MNRSERARLALTILAALAAGGVAGAGVGAHLLSPAVAVSLAVLMGLAAGSQVLRAVLKAKRDAASGQVRVTEAIACATLLVREYDEAIEFFTRALGFRLLEDTPLGEGKRWVVVAPGRSTGMRILLARASTPSQERCIGNQTGGRVSFFLNTGDFAASHETMRQRGVRFLEPPRSEPYGTVAVFADLYGNRWDLLESRGEAPIER